MASEEERTDVSRFSRADFKEHPFVHRLRFRDEIETVDPDVIVTLGAEATTRTLQVLGVTRSQANCVRVSPDYGRSEFDPEWPVVISLQRAQRTLKRTEYLPVVQRALQNALDARIGHEPTTESMTDVVTTRTDDDVQALPEQSSADDPHHPHQVPTPSMTDQPDLNVFLVPVDWPNFGETVQTEPIELAQYTERPSPLRNRDEVRLWGARVGDRNRSAFEAMSTGDLLLFYNDKRYVGKGRVGQTFEDPEGWVAETFWNGAPSRLIYTVERFHTIDVPRNTVNRLFDYTTDYYPQGLMRVAESRVTENFGTVWRTFQRFS